LKGPHNTSKIATASNAQLAILILEQKYQPSWEKTTRKRRRRTPTTRSEKITKLIKQSLEKLRLKKIANYYDSKIKAHAGEGILVGHEKRKE